jgi:dipeptidyl aminopeptidase/acylaminoacyl peptidase
MRKLLRTGLCVALLASLASAQGGFVTPGDNLIVEGIPKISSALAERVARYTESRSAGLASWHPVRREMIISTRFGDTPQLHLVKMPGGARTQLTFFPDRVGGGSFRPRTGDSFIFSKDIGGNEFFQYYRFDTATGAVTLLTDGKSRNTGWNWSNAGDRAVYNSTRRNGRDTDFYVVSPADPQTTKLLMQVEGGGWGVADWSPDDRRLIIGEYVSANESYFWLADAQAGTKELLTPKGGPEKVSYQGAQFSKDGRGVYVTTDKDSEFHRLAYVDLATKKHVYLTDHIKWDVDGFELSPDGRIIAFVTNEDGIGRLHLMDTRTRRQRPAPKLPVGIVGGVEWHENGRDLGFTFVSSRGPADVYSLDVMTGKVERWTESETGGINTSQLPEPELVRWQSFDGRQISGFLYRPPARFTGKRPVIINIHGGPEGQSRPAFLGRNNFFLNEQGVAVIFPNVRGSTGYGKTFLAMDNGMKREDTYKDIAALLDWIGTRPDLDASRVMVTGGSYGGHMAFAVATYYSDKIRASLPVVGISNFVTFLENTESYRRDLRRAEYGDERDPEMRKFFERTAPLNNAGKIKKPIFIVQGYNDPRVPRTESEQIAKKVRSGDTPVWFLMARDEGHGFAKKKNQDFQFYATVMFVEEYLLK